MQTVIDLIVFSAAWLCTMLLRLEAGWKLMRSLWRTAPLRLRLFAELLSGAVMILAIVNITYAVLNRYDKRVDEHVQVLQLFPSHNTTAATATMEQDGEIYYDITCLWYQSGGYWHAVILSGTEVIDRRFYHTQEDLLREIRRDYQELPMANPAEVTAEVLNARR